ncbi:unannotated protein [freshwater metagenome]|uniref:Unannotated protein n=1 Tax=freshwater metagenome TaxID=449393 RepID=A0A6J7AG56_9ZZZZ
MLKVGSIFQALIDEALHVDQGLGVFSIVIGLRVTCKESILLGCVKAVNRRGLAYSTGVKAHNVIALKDVWVKDVFGVKGVFDTAYAWPTGINNERADSIVLVWIAVADNSDIKFAKGCVGVIDWDFQCRALEITVTSCPCEF